MSNQAEAMMQDQIEGAISENEALRREVERLREAGQILVDAYRERFQKPSTKGLRSNAPLLREFAEFNAALQKKA